MWSHAHDKNIASDKGHFEDFLKEKGRFFIMSCFSWHILLQGQEFWVLQLIPYILGTKIEIYYSLLLFTVTVHDTVHDTVHSEFLPI